MQNTEINRPNDVSRPILGPLMDVICFRYLLDDAEDLAGRALIIDAGRHLGRHLVESLGLVGKHTDAEEIKEKLGDALGINGLRLCVITKVVGKPNGGYQVHATESVRPAYTLGVLLGAFSAITGKKMVGSDAQTEMNGEGRIYHLEEFI